MAPSERMTSRVAWAPMSLSVVEELDAGCAIATELDSRRQRTRQYRKVWLVHDGVDV